MRIIGELRAEWMKIPDLEGNFDFSTIFNVFKNLTSMVEIELITILNQNINRKTSINIESNMELLDPKLSTKETLKKISINLNLKASFEKILMKNFNIGNWFFWLDVTKILEDTNDIKKEQLFYKLQDITQKYLLQTSTDEVKEKKKNLISLIFQKRLPLKVRLNQKSRNMEAI